MRLYLFGFHVIEYKDVFITAGSYEEAIMIAFLERPHLVGYIFEKISL